MFGCGSSPRAVLLGDSYDKIRGRFAGIAVHASQGRVPPGDRADNLTFSLGWTRRTIVQQDGCWSRVQTPDGLLTARLIRLLVAAGQ